MLWFKRNDEKFWKTVSDLKHAKRCMDKVCKSYAKHVWAEMKKDKSLCRGMIKDLRNDPTYHLYRRIKKLSAI